MKRTALALLVVLMFSASTNAQDNLRRFWGSARLASPLPPQVVTNPCPAGFSVANFHQGFDNTNGNLRPWLCVNNVTGEAAFTANVVGVSGACGAATLVQYSGGASAFDCEATFTFNETTNRLSGVDFIESAGGDLVLGLLGSTTSLATNGNERFIVSSTGHLNPALTDTYDFGGALNRVRTIYANNNNRIMPGGVTWDCPTSLAAGTCEIEDWIGAGAVCTTGGARLCGSTWTWWLTGTNASMAAAATNETNHPGMRIIRSGNASPNQAEFQVTAAQNTLTGGNTYDYIVVVKPEDADLTTKQRVGLSSDIGTDPPADGCYFEKLLADTNWFRVCRTAGAETREDTLVAHTVNWFTMRIQKVNATTVGLAICSGEACTLPAVSNIATNVPLGTLELRPTILTETNAAATKGIFLDVHALKITGLVR